MSVKMPVKMLIFLLPLLCSAVTRVQVTGNAAGATSVGSGFANITDSQAFSSNVTAGNTILVFFGGSAVTGTLANWGTGFNSCTDTLGNSYSLIFFSGSNILDGGGMAACVAIGIVGGADTVTVSIVSGTGFSGSSYSMNMSISEYVCRNCRAFTSNNAKSFGSPGNTPIGVGITDSGRTAVTVTFSGTAGSGGPGSICSLGTVDLVDSAGMNFLTAAGKTNATITTIVGSSPYGSMAQQFTASNADNWFFFDGTSTTYGVSGYVGIL